MSRSRIQDELEALKKRGIAQTRKESLKDAKTFRTPEEERALIKKIFLQKYKRNFANIPKPSKTSSTSEWDAWHLHQRKLALLEKKKKQEAEKALRMYRGSVSARNIVNTKPEKKLDKSVSHSNVLRPSKGSKDEQAIDDISTTCTEQSDELLAIEEEADKELDAFIEQMKTMKEEDVQAMLESVETEEELSIDSGVTPPTKNTEDEVIAVDSKGDIVVAEADEKKEESVEEKVEEPEAEPEPVVEKEEEPESFQEFCFRDVIDKDENSHFPAEKGRYELYLSPACPRSHEVQVVLALKGLTDVITTVTADPILQPLSSDEETEFFGWVFPDDASDKDVTTGNKFKNILELYQAADDTSEGKYTLPVLWDTTHRTIVNNNFYDILRILNNEFNDFATNPELDLYPEQLKKEIASFHTWMYESLTNGVYKCAVATTQENYTEAVTTYAEAFDKMQSILSESSYLIENTFTIVDVCLFCSLFRLDEVYNPRFYMNTRSVMSSESMKAFCKQIYSMDNVKDTCDIDTIKQYYFGNAIVPERKIIPIGPNFLNCLV